jgi:predicted DCC family thiol-disulfide oxidoreductase YuxK
MGVVLLVDLIVRMASIEAFYSDLGAVPRHAITEQLYRIYNISIHFITGSAALQTVLFLINAVFILCFIIGYRTRLMSVLCWLFYISLINRNPVVVHGGDVVVRCMLFWCMFVPLGIYYSVDAALQRYAYPEEKIFSPGTMALMLQLLFVYFFSAMHKTHAQWFPEGTAIAYALQLHAFATPIGIFLRDFPSSLYYMTISTYFLEMLGPVFMLIPFSNMEWRMPVLLAFLGLHIGIFLTMRIGMFPWMCMVAWMIFLPSELWNWILGTIKKSGQGIRIYFDADCSFCKKSVHILRHLLLLGNSEVFEGQSDSEVYQKMERQNSWIIQDENGQFFDRYDAFLVLIRNSPFSCFTFLFSNQVSHWLGSKIYLLVSRNRDIAGKFTAPLQWKNKIYHHSKAHTFLVIFFLSLVLLNNLSGIKWNEMLFDHLFRVPQALKPVNRILRLDQSWDMFAPRPMRNNDWYWIGGTLVDGSEIVLVNQDPRENPGRPADFENSYSSHRWSKFTRNLVDDEFDNYLLYYGKYLCRKTNKDLAGKGRLDRFDIKIITQRTSLDQPNPFKERTLWKHKCGSGN